MAAHPDIASADLAVLYVDDEPVSRKLFSRSFGDEFTIVTAHGVSDALEVLERREHEYAVLLTDYRMPERDGMKLLQTVRREHRHLIRLLATAYAEKEVAIEAVNQGQVLRILEKPLEETTTREALREAFALYRAQAFERSLNEGRAVALRETMGFLAHELNTPLATVRGFVSTVIARHVPAPPGTPAGIATFSENRPGELLAALENAERRALYCQSLVSTFVQSARDAFPGAAPPEVAASALAQAVLDEFPFDADERSWVTSHVMQDFMLPGRRDLLYLVLCTVTKNALIALRGRARPSLRIEVGQDPDGRRRPWIRFQDNGPGIPADVLAKLTREPVTTRASTGGNGMGLMFCQRVMQSIGGEIRITSDTGWGTTVSLCFRPPSAGLA
ncbi:hybrid sensor histidine kinase/response regulator [Caenimonas aquaedulcis]|uniref:histidine kinase n=1 Tax=Caenimonas aquaedulcis TaxID=2793270 RepID=A0A931MIF7_9BURK|nr:hybrid sensor histidine kinase/response regulator [Caenimonas aquaedulcis]MBG9389748.1 hybrid sensor histidine kinase/response regulator [Caenimonas aquaedulcis]